MLVGRSSELFNNRITDLQCIALLEVLEAISTVETINISYNRIGDTAASAISRFLEVSFIFIYI